MYSRFTFTACFVAVACAIALAGPGDAVAQTGEKTSEKKKQRVVKDPYAVPGNYRQLVARHIAQNPPRARLLNSQISPPGVWEAPLGIGSPAPIVCARLTIESTFSPTTYSIGFRFKDGQIQDTFNPQAINPAAGGIFASMMLNSVTCGKLSYRPFPELKQTLQSKR